MRLSIVVASFVASATVGAACDVARDVPGSGSSVQIDFVNAGAFSVRSIDYTISGNGIEPLMGTISLTDPNSTPSIDVGAVPPGLQYLLELRAAPDDGSGQCYGAAAFDVARGRAVDVAISLVCSYPTPVRTIMIDGMTDYCPSLASYAASPSTGVVGGAPVSLSATAFSFYSEAPRFSWQASMGDLSSDDTSVTSYTCAAPGIATLTVTVTDGLCPDSASLVVTCLPAQSNLDAAARDGSGS
ncbi:MAG TPA: hypothetical protein VLA14_13175 [Polyangia bacterium]|nr:hypothetical protein [Polyangia bacterium]